MVYPVEAIRLIRENPRYKEDYPLHDAVNSGDLNRIRTCLQSGISLEAKDICKKTPLQCAIECIDDPDLRYNICEYLLDQGANVNETDGFNEQVPLHSIWSPHRNVQDGGRLFDLLISKGALIDKKDGQMHTPLYLAVVSEDVITVEKLLDLGADPNEVDNAAIGSAIKACALLRAIESRSEKLVRLLLENGLDLSNTNEHIFLDRTYTIYIQSDENVKFTNRRMLIAVLKQLAIQRKTSRPLSKFTLRLIYKIPELRNEFERYLQQIDVMKATIVRADLNLVYFDLLVSDRETLTSYCNGDMLNVLAFKKPEIMFPDFVGRVRRNVQRGFIEKKIREDFEELLFEVLKPTLSFDLVRMICKFLKMSDLIGFRFRRHWIGSLRN